MTFKNFLNLNSPDTHPSRSPGLKSIESLINTKRAGDTKYTTVSVTRDAYIEADIICAELNCSKAKFVTLAMTKLIDEYRKTQKEEQ